MLDRYGSMKGYLTAWETLRTPTVETAAGDVIWFDRDRVFGLEISIQEAWELAYAITTGIVVEQAEELWTVASAVVGVPVGFYTEVAEWKLVMTIFALPVDVKTELVDWTLADSTSAEVGVEREDGDEDGNGEEEEGKVNWWIWGGLATAVVVVIVIVIARRRG